MENTKNLFLKAAAEFGNRICRDAIWDDERCNWITSDVDESSGFHRIFFHSLGPEFYNGTSGIAYFLANLYSKNNDAIIKITANGAIRQALQGIKITGSNTNLSFFSGALGVIWTGIKIGHIFGDRDLVADSTNILRGIIAETPAGPEIDVIDGYAGSIPVLLNLYNDLRMTECFETALKIGDYLVSIKQKENQGVSWETTTFKKRNLTGFAHGAAGIANALFELYDFTGDEKFKLAAEEGIQYENHQFNNEEQNWPDFRDFQYHGQNENKSTPCSCAWCHGAPGIGLSRLRAFEITGNELYKQDALTAISTTIKNNNLKKTGNFSLCHGLFGNSELLVEAARVLNEKKYFEEAEKIGRMAIDTFINESIPLVNGVNNSFDNPEFMTGAAGMGYFYLRLFNAEKFPCIISLNVAGRSGKKVLEEPGQLFA